MAIELLDPLDDEDESECWTSYWEQLCFLVFFDGEDEGDPEREEGRV